MTYASACALLQLQARNLRKVNNTRFVIDKYEYKITYFGGFAAYVGIDRREVGKRNFKFFGGLSAASCMSVESLMIKIREEIDKELSRGK